jgi:hypothetical protein
MATKVFISHQRDFDIESLRPISELIADWIGTLPGCPVIPLPRATTPSNPAIRAARRRRAAERSRERVSYGLD